MDQTDPPAARESFAGREGQGLLQRSIGLLQHQNTLQIFVAHCALLRTPILVGQPPAAPAGAAVCRLNGSPALVVQSNLCRSAPLGL